MDSENDAGRPAIRSEVLRLDHHDPVPAVYRHGDRQYAPGQSNGSRPAGNSTAKADKEFHNDKLNGTIKQYRNTCAVCGKLYDMRIYRNGLLYGIRTKYCSEECQKKGKYKRDRLNMQKYTERRREYRDGPQAGNKRKHAEYAERIGTYVGPNSGVECWGCPMMGWKCRTQSIPPCREHGKRHKEYVQLVAFWKEMI